MDDVTGNVFSLFCSTWRAILKMFVRLIWIQASESREKKLARAICTIYITKKKKMEKRRQKELFTT